MVDLDCDSSPLTELSPSTSGLSSAPSSPIAPFELNPPYPTPDSSQTQSTDSSSSEPESRKRRRKNGDEPPSKRKKTTENGEKETEYLDLRRHGAATMDEQTSQVEMLMKVLKKKRKIVVVAGAGISTAAGVPDFRSSKGLFTTLRSEGKVKGSGKQLFDASVYQTDDSTSSFHDMVRSLSKAATDAKATAFHHMLATLAHEGRLLRLYTQNVDGLDVDIDPLATQIPLPKKGPWPRTIQLHGSLKKMVCAKCGDLKEFDPELFDGPNPPACPCCISLDKVRTEEAGKRSHGIGKLRPRMVLYNEHNPDADAIGAVVTADLRARPDAIIVVGTSMEIPGVQRMVKEMCKVIKDRRDGKCIWMNLAAPPPGPRFEDCWHLVVSGECDRVAELANMRKWYEEPVDVVPVTESDAERTKAKEGNVQVVVDTMPVPSIKHETSLPTPAPSPKPESKQKAPIKLKINGPAPRGKVLGAKKDRKPAEANAKPKRRKQDAKKAASLPKIKHQFPVSKAQVGRPRAASKSKKNAGHSPFDESQPFEPVPPHSARNNFSLTQDTKSLHGSAATKAGSPHTPNRSPSYSPGRLQRMREETISPTGSVPKGMARLLN